ncbi:SpaA isopeptide-forming pilin-related protein [Streptomyces sp. NBC_01601]|uniref:SpaA isopeptide-forming pilin-related protein n=1 Tax=Streptomyces sp. NBC_01601 TaxID=2975892 RepID=UPI002E2E4321|nr:SpaA isopeptide-forming pilin-related protein [Streptomyces sp. NBC_01601]
MGVLFAPHAVAADKWGPGYQIPDSTGTADASHIGGYNVTGTGALAYCGDPELAGPEAAGGYGPAQTITAWTSKTTGNAASAEDLARASYVLSKYGQTTTDDQAAAVDAVVYTYLDAGSTYALPNGKRALERLAYPNVAPSAKKWAIGYLNEAAMFAGPYTINIKPTDGPLKAGKKTVVTLDVTAASGHKVPGITLDLTVTGASAGTANVVTNADGLATTTITPAKDGTVDLKALAKSLPATNLRAVSPNNAKAQRLLLAGGTSSAEAQVHLKVERPHGTLTVTKTAAGTNTPLSGVEFEVKDASGATVAAGKTDSNGLWQAGDLAAGTYTVHEVKAVEGYQLAADQTATVTDEKTSHVTVEDVKVPVQPKLKPRPVTIPALPQTGA